MNEKNDFAEDFLQGQKDCRDGKPHTDKSEAYTRGYNTEYQAEQMRGEQCRLQTH